MAYVKITDFAAKDALITGNPLKLITGTGLGAEFDAIAAASALAADLSSAQTLTNKVINASNNTVTNVSLTTGITGTLPVTHGGTGQASFTSGSLLVGGGTGAITEAAAYQVVAVLGSTAVNNATTAVNLSGGTVAATTITASSTVVATGTVSGATATSAAHLMRYDQVLGVGQTYQNVTASRASGGGPYTNSTGKPIYVMVQGNGAGGVGHVSLTAVVGGVTLPVVSSYNDASHIDDPLIGFIVPAGLTYSVTIAATAGGATLISWVELR